MCECVCECTYILFFCAPSASESPVLQLVAKNMQGSKRKPVFSDQLAGPVAGCQWPQARLGSGLTGVGVRRGKVATV